MKHCITVIGINSSRTVICHIFTSLKNSSFCPDPITQKIESEPWRDLQVQHIHYWSLVFGDATIIATPKPEYKSILKHNVLGTPRYIFCSK